MNEMAATDPTYWCDDIPWNHSTFCDPVYNEPQIFSSEQMVGDDYGDNYFTATPDPLVSPAFGGFVPIKTAAAEFAVSPTSMTTASSDGNSFGHYESASGYTPASPATRKEKIVDTGAAKENEQGPEPRARKLGGARCGGRARNDSYSDDSPKDLAHTKPRNGREKNRIAAAKCRRKAKEDVGELQERERALLQQNRLLQAAKTGLKDQILDLKHELLRHSECDSEVIQNYIKRAAREVA